LFLKCIDWEDVHETEQAIDLMNQWQPPESSSALGLLSSDYTNSQVKKRKKEKIEREKE
jgi:hypothetical protein